MDHRRSTCLVILLALSHISAFTQEYVPLNGTHYAQIRKSIRQRIEMREDRFRCAADKSIFVTSIDHFKLMRISSDGNRLQTYSVDAIPGLKNAFIEDFAELPNGEIHVLIRELLKSRSKGKPAVYGRAAIVRFVKDGGFRSMTFLSGIGGDFEPVGIAPTSHGYLVASTQLRLNKNAMTFRVDHFQADGTRASKQPLVEDSSQATNLGHADSPHVWRPMFAPSNGLIYVLRGSTRSPVYVFNGAGELLRMIRLKPNDLEFSNPVIDRDRLVVQPHLRKGWPRRLQAIYVFELQSGTIKQVLALKEEAQLACIDDDKLTFLALEPDQNSIAILTAIPSSSSNAASIRKDGNPAALQLRWVVPCGDDAGGVPVFGDDLEQTRCLLPQSVVTADDLVRVSMEVEDDESVSLRLEFTKEAGDRIRRASLTAGDRLLGFVVDGRLVAAARVHEPLGEVLLLSFGEVPLARVEDVFHRLNQLSGKVTS